MEVSRGYRSFRSFETGERKALPFSLFLSLHAAIFITRWLRILECNSIELIKLETERKLGKLFQLKVKWNVYLRARLLEKDRRLYKYLWKN